MAASTNTNKTTVTEKDLEWFSASEDQTPEAFFNYLKTTDQKRAHIRYRRVLRDCAVDEDHRKNLVDAFNTWRAAEAEMYWEKRKAGKSVRKTQIRTAVSLVETSEPFAVDLLQSNAREAREDLQEHEQAEPGRQIDVQEVDPEEETDLQKHADSEEQLDPKAPTQQGSSMFDTFNMPSMPSSSSREYLN
jgi:hypothetical protein